MTPDASLPQYSIWLLLQADEEAELQAEVDALAPRFEGHRFQPHLTLQGDLALALPVLEALTADLSSQVAPQRWPVTGVGATEHFFRALYLQFDAGNVFDRSRQQCRDATGTAQGLSPYPHLSLAYGRVQADARADAQAEALSLPADAPADPPTLRDRLETKFRGRRLCFDRVALVLSSKHVPIARWQVLAAHRFHRP